MMTEILIKLFIKDKENVGNSKVRGKYGMLSSITGIVVNIVLSIVKLIIGIIANSMSIISDGLNNVTDAGSSVITLFGLRMSQKAEDSEHPWGHGRMEYITAFIVDIFIILVGFELFKSSIEKIFHPEMQNINNITIILLIIAILSKLWLFVFYKKIANKINSSAIKATAYDSISDTVSTLVVLISALISKFFGITIDGYISLLVSIFILYTGYKATKEIIDILLGAKPDSKFIQDLEELVKKTPEIAGVHDIMVHDYGPGRKIVSFHAEVPANSDICKVHDIIDCLEKEIYTKFGCITTIHMDPIVVDNEEINKMKQLIEKIVHEINKDFSIHDFRMTDGGEHTNLIFDLVIPAENNKEKEKIEKMIKEKLKQENDKYYAVMQIENSFV